MSARPLDASYVCRDNSNDRRNKSETRRGRFDELFFIFLTNTESPACYTLYVLSVTHTHTYVLRVGM